MLSNATSRLRRSTRTIRNTFRLTYTHNYQQCEKDFKNNTRPIDSTHSSHVPIEPHDTQNRIEALPEVIVDGNDIHLRLPKFKYLLVNGSVEAPEFPTPEMKMKDAWYMESPRVDNSPYCPRGTDHSIPSHGHEWNFETISTEDLRVHYTEIISLLPSLSREQLLHLRKALERL